MNINETFKKLTQEEKDCLMQSFDNLTSHVVKLDNNRFLGVHCDNDTRLNIEETNGYWFLGEFK